MEKVDRVIAGLKCCIASDCGNCDYCLDRCESRLLNDALDVINGLRLRCDRLVAELAEERDRSARWVRESEPVVHAHWFGNDDPQGWFDKIVYCSACHCGDSTVRSPYCRYCGAKMDEKVMVPMYLGKCEETDCENWRWSGDSYHDRNTECFCLLNGKSVYRHEADEKRIECPLGKMMEYEEDEE